MPSTRLDPDALAQAALRQRAVPRLRYRQALPVLDFDGRAVPVLDWSRQGVGFVLPGHRLRVGARFRARLRLELVRARWVQPVRVRVAWVSGDRIGAEYRIVFDDVPPDPAGA